MAGRQIIALSAESVLRGICSLYMGSRLNRTRPFADFAPNGRVRFKRALKAIIGLVFGDAVP